MISGLAKELEGFEVIQGYMDDVFLNAVGKVLNEEGERKSISS